MNQLWEMLQSFGMTQYEAKAYISLVSQGTTNAYQISKESGLPRARVYDTLVSLVNRGAVMVEEEDDGSKLYTAVPVEVFLDKVKKKWETTYHTVETELKKLENKGPSKENYVATVRGAENILSFCRMLIRRASFQITLSVWNEMYQELEEDLRKREREGVRIRGIAFQVDHPMSGLHQHRMNDYMRSLNQENWFILSIDSKELLYGHSIVRDGNAFYTDDPVHLYLLEDYIWHDVLVNQLVAKGEQEILDQWIIPEMNAFFGKLHNL
ncbi:TrmB family transcriptional regulator [Brevibacillus ginsengisoli]|uniref:TrmB family transcriptional regulator n=1 Tax=Brevibacillus ginsengisoli TaxID=363854 RepID=UPI003CEEAD35